MDISNTPPLPLRLRMTLATAYLFSIGCASAPEPAPVIAPPAPPAIAPPIAQAPPPLVIPERPVEERVNEVLVQSTSNHAQYMRHIAQATQIQFASVDDINITMDNLAAGFAPRLSGSWISYGSLIAAQNQDFVESVRNTARYEGVNTVLDRLYTDPNFVLTFASTDQAQSDIKSAWRDHLVELTKATTLIKEQSYSLQKDKAWKTTKADNRKTRLATMKSAQTARLVTDFDTQRNIAQAGTVTYTDPQADVKRQIFQSVFTPQAVFNTSLQTPSTSNSAPSLAMRKALTLGALEALGATGAQSSQWLESYTQDGRVQNCTNWARLHAEQCVAAAYYKYEDTFCIAEHQLSDIQACLVKFGF